MKNNIFLLIMFAFYLSNGQNLIVNGKLDTGTLNGWSGSANQVVTDDITNSSSGNCNFGDSNTNQEFNVTEGKTYNVSFDYRWVSGTGNYNMNVNVKEGASGSNVLGSLVLNTTPDVWYNGTFTFTVPVGITSARLIFQKYANSRILRFDNVFVAEQGVAISLIDPNTPTNAQPLGVPGSWDLEFSDEFNDTSLNNSKWFVSESTKSRAARPNLGVDDWWWKPQNTSLNGTGDLVLRATKVDNNTMYCGSVESRNLYEPTYGYLEARIKIAVTAKGNHTAFWLQGHNQGNVDNSGADGAEVDIFESAWVTNTTKAVVHIDGYGTFAKNQTIPYNTPNLHKGYHVFGLYWTSAGMDIYYDGSKVVSTNASRPFPFTTTSAGYPVVPQVPEWLWLSVGASFGDGDFQSQAVGTLSDALVDYVRVYKSVSTLAINDFTDKEAFLLFPNPAQNAVTIKSEESNYALKVYDLNGRIIKSSKESKTATIDVSNFAKGLYIFKLISNETIINYKIIVN